MSRTAQIGRKERVRTIGIIESEIKTRFGSRRIKEKERFGDNKARDDIEPDREKRKDKDRTLGYDNGKIQNT